MLVVGQEAGQVAELGRGAGGGRAAAVAIGAEHRAVGERRVAEQAEVGRLHRLEPAGGVAVDAEVLGVVHRHARRADPLVGPDRMQEGPGTA